MDVNELQVLACDPPRDAVRVRVADGSYIELHVPPASLAGVEHVVAIRRGMLTVVIGHSSILPLGLLTEEDLLLGSVQMPAHTATVQQSQIVDRRGWGEHGEVCRWGESNSH